MFHMLTCFDLKPGQEIDGYRARWSAFVEHMLARDLICGSSEIGARVRDTGLDTDTARDHGFFVILHFRDRAQADAAWDEIAAHRAPSDARHGAVLAPVADPIFICWQDLGAAGPRIAAG